MDTVTCLENHPTLFGMEQFNSQLQNIKSNGSTLSCHVFVEKRTWTPRILNFPVHNTWMSDYCQVPWFPLFFGHQNRTNKLRVIMTWIPLHSLDMGSFRNLEMHLDLNLSTAPRVCKWSKRRAWPLTLLGTISVCLLKILVGEKWWEFLAAGGSLLWLT